MIIPFRFYFMNSNEDSCNLCPYSCRTCIEESVDDKYNKLFEPLNTELLMFSRSC